MEDFSAVAVFVLLAIGFVLIWWGWRSGLYGDTETARRLRRRKR
jgi:nitrogen fixation-related uncharacterized protein